MRINIASSFNPAPNGPFTIELKWTFGPTETPWFNLQPAPIDVPAYAGPRIVLCRYDLLKGFGINSKHSGASIAYWEKK